MTAKVPNTKVRYIPRIEHGRRSGTVGVVIHTMESDSLDGVENYFRTSSPDGVGAHFGIGPKGEVRQWAHLSAKCYHAPGGNSDRLGIEHCGFASWTTAKWLTRARQLRASANRTAWLCWHYKLGLPHHGTNVLGHYQLGGGHYDPGPNFPWTIYMKYCRMAYRVLKRTNGRHWL